jgi:hypothetical protein
VPRVRQRSLIVQQPHRTDPWRQSELFERDGGFMLANVVHRLAMNFGSGFAEDDY